jgi:hypothetical protein
MSVFVYVDVMKIYINPGFRKEGPEQQVSRMGSRVDERYEFRL